MQIPFYKYHGTGNDFIIIDKIRNKNIVLNENMIKTMCNRKLGIGADGLMTISASDNCDFKMKYYNSDGNEGSMCGNGGRCIVSYARTHNIINTSETYFEAVDGIHKAFIEKDIVKLKMRDVHKVNEYNDGYFLNTGSPHFVKITDNINAINIEEHGKKLRNDKRFAPEGTNVNFVEINNSGTVCATYERGVEKETLSCGTGVVATAVALTLNRPQGEYSSKITTKGGTLKIIFNKHGNNFTDIWLEAETKFVFEGKIDI